MRKIYVYLAGPYSYPDPVENTSDAVSVADELTRYGFLPYIPHLTLFWHYMHPHPIEFWYKFDLAWLEKCDELLRLPGTSPGADKEIEYAIEHGIRIFRNMNEFVAYHIGEGDIKLNIELVDLGKHEENIDSPKGYIP